MLTITTSSVIVPVKVLGASDGNQAVAVGEHGKDTNLVVVFELSTYITSRYDTVLRKKENSPEEKQGISHRALQIR
jgi:hypothetical protein